MTAPHYLMLDERKRTPLTDVFAMANVRKYGMRAGGPVAHNNRGFQDALDANAGVMPVFVPKGSTYYEVTARFTAPANTHIVLAPGAEIRWTATSATGTALLGTTTRPGIEITGDVFRIEGSGILRGPSSSSVAGEIALFTKGTSRTVPRVGLSVGHGVEIRGWGYGGVVAQYVDDFSVLGAQIHDGAHAGVMVFSARNIAVAFNRIYAIEPDGSGNCYGISLTHETTSYSEPGGNGRVATNPFCIGGMVAFNTVYDLDDWVGIDAHGGDELVFAYNRVNNCRHGVHLSSSSGDATNYAGENNSVLGNFITTRKRDGTATSVSATDRLGINVSGGSSVRHRGVTVEGNTIDGYGDTVPSSQSIKAVYVTGAAIRNNKITNWKGQAIYTSQFDGIIEGNRFDAVGSATNSKCVSLDTASEAIVRDNRHEPGAGTVSDIGLRIEDAANVRCLIAGNDFESATTPYSNFDGTQTYGASDIPPQVTATGTPTSISVAACGKAPHVWIYLNVSGISTVTDITGVHVGQRISLYSPTTNATTFDRTNAALAGGANYVSSQYDTLHLLCVATSGTKFTELSRSANA